MNNVMNNDKINENKKEELIRFIDENSEEGGHHASLMSILHKAQSIYGYINEDTIETISEHLLIPTAKIWGVVTFYHYFSLKPRGKYIIAVCMGTACYVKGSQKVLDTLKEVLGVEEGEMTEDGLFTIEAKYCLGCCGLAPVMMVNDDVYEKLTTKKIVGIIEDLRAKNKTSVVSK
jgi:NADH:ubiquinone oxidoreductase subunit E